MPIWSFQPLTTFRASMVGFPIDPLVALADRSFNSSQRPIHSIFATAPTAAFSDRYHFHDRSPLATFSDRPLAALSDRPLAAISDRYLFRDRSLPAFVHPTSNAYNFCIRTPFSTILYSLESSQKMLSFWSDLRSKYYSYRELWPKQCRWPENLPLHFVKQLPRTNLTSTLPNGSEIHVFPTNTYTHKYPFQAIKPYMQSKHSK